MAGLLDGRGETASFVVAGGNKDGLGLAVGDKVNDSLEGLVVFKHLADLSSRIVVVASVVDAASLNHEEEALVGVLGCLFEGSQGGGSHLAQTGVHIVLLLSVDLKGHVSLSKEAEEGKVDLVAAVEGIEALAIVGVGPAVLLLSQACDIDVICTASALGGVGKEMAAAATEHKIDRAAQNTLANLLKRDGVLHFSYPDVANEAGWCGICDVGRDDESGCISRSLCRLHDRSAWLGVGEDRDGAVVALEAAGEGGRAGSAVSHHGVGGARAAGTPEVLVQGKSVVYGEVVDVLSVASSQGERGWSHAVRDHEDEVSLGSDLVVVVMRLRGMLDPDGSDDESARGNEAPDEEDDLADP